MYMFMYVIQPMCDVSMPLEIFQALLGFVVGQRSIDAVGARRVGLGTRLCTCTLPVGFIFISLPVVTFCCQTRGEGSLLLHNAARW